MLAFFPESACHVGITRSKVLCFTHTHIKFYSNIQSLPTKRGERQFLLFELKTALALFLVEIYYIYSPGNLPRLNHIRHIAWMQLLVAIFVVTSDAISRDSARRDTIHGPSSDRVHAGLGKTIGPAARIFTKGCHVYHVSGGSNFGWETVPENLQKWVRIYSNIFKSGPGAVSASKEKSWRLQTSWRLATW